jgi:hypothetical protein
LQSSNITDADVSDEAHTCPQPLLRIFSVRYQVRRLMMQLELSVEFFSSRHSARNSIDAWQSGCSAPSSATRLSAANDISVIASSHMPMRRPEPATRTALASTRPRATGTTEFADIGDVVRRGQNRGSNRRPAASPLADRPIPAKHRTRIEFPPRPSTDKPVIYRRFDCMISAACRCHSEPRLSPFPHLRLTEFPPTNVCMYRTPSQRTTVV